MHSQRTILMIALLTLLLASCRHEETIYPTLVDQVAGVSGKGGLYVLCEGNMGSNKARLDYMNLETGIYYSNWYGAQNPHQLKELGDVGNDLQQYGHRLYAVINCSHKVEVMTPRGTHIGQVNLPNCRYMAFYGNKMYVSAYVGSVVDADLLGSVYEVDTASLQVVREVKVGHQPDELCIGDDRLYVCNSGGYLTNRYDSTVSVIDLTSFTETERIPVGLNPTRIRRDRNGRLWVCCQGNYSDRAPEVVVVEGSTIVKRFAVPCMNMDLCDDIIYILDGENKVLRRFSTATLTEQPAALSLVQYEHPYGLLVTSEALYVTDAKNYVSSGILHCYSPAGVEQWQWRTGDIPAHLCRVAQAYDLNGGGDDTPATGQSPYITRVYEFVPGMGQFVNELPKYNDGDDAAAMCRKCETAIANNAGGMVSLGGWGGYITFGFDHPVQNGEGADLRVLGNAFYMSGSSEYGSSEPGIVMVSRDDNGNGLPDDKWYELKGCLYDDAGTQHNVTRTYKRSADTLHNPFHNHPYYPQWIAADEITLRGTLLPKQSVVISGQNVQRILDWGYVDNKPNTDITGTSFDISWAIDADGSSVSLPCADFVRVYTAVDETLPMTGELSTEVSGAIDLHVLNN